MKYHALGDSGIQVSELSFGTWAIGGDWGKKDDNEALQALERAMDLGVNFFDTADVYGTGHSESLLAKATKGKEDTVHIATKFCRLGDIHDSSTYSEKQIRSYCEDSLKRLERERIDLYQIHCAPFEILQQGTVFEVLEKLKQEGKIRSYGVSVETIEEGLFVLENTNASALQVIFNVLRQKPQEKLFVEAMRKGVGILARVPLASGLLTGKYTSDHEFEADDHRNYNKDGQAFNIGETFGGLPFQKGVALANEIKWMAEGRDSLTRASLKWILSNPAVTSVIPGFRNTKQVEDNLASLAVKSFSEEELKQIESFYWENVHAHIRGVY